MFMCQVTKKITKPCEKCNKITLLTRAREYKNSFYNEESRRMEETESSFGSEIVLEVNASDEGLAVWNAMNDEDRSSWVKRYVK